MARVEPHEAFQRHLVAEARNDEGSTKIRGVKVADIDG